MSNTYYDSLPNRRRRQLDREPAAALHEVAIWLKESLQGREEKGGQFEPSPAQIQYAAEYLEEAAGDMEEQLNTGLRYEIPPWVPPAHDLTAATALPSSRRGLPNPKAFVQAVKDKIFGPTTAMVKSVLDRLE
ncbi:MAG: hypothetical protein Q9224_007626 [Gallowayella concinna]